MFTNSLLAGALGAAFLTIIVVQLNPHVPILSATPWRWFLTLATLYGFHIAVISYAIIVAREFFAMDVMSPGWASVRVLAWLSAALAAAAATLMWLNVRGFEQALGAEAARRMTVGATATTASAVVLLVIAIAHYSFGRRGSRVGASLFALAVVAALALPVAARGLSGAARPLPAAWRMQPPASEPARDGPRVTLIALDGASLGYIMPRAAEGRLPNFRRVLDGGAVIDLATIRPTQPDPVWVAAATGMYPGKSGVRSATQYFAGRDTLGIDLLPDHCLSHGLVRLGFVRDEPHSSDQWRTRPLWGVLSDAGMTTGIVRWPLTHPVQPALGFVVSDRLHQLVGTIRSLDTAAYPGDAILSVQEAVSTPDLREADLGAAMDFAQGSPEAAALGRDLLYSGVARALRAERSPRFLTVRYEGLDVVGHYYLRYTQPPTPRGVPEAARRRFVQIIDRYHAFIDAELGAAVDGMRPGDLVLVVSAFGMHRTNPLKRALSRALGDPDLTGTHERAPDGFMMAYGSAVQRGRTHRGSIVDVAPTVLYFFGLPVALDMDGFARPDLFTREFTAERPITFIPSYR